MKAKALLSGSLAALLVSCGGPLVLRMRGIKPLNENDRKENVPVDVRIYQLRDDARFERATVENLWTKDKETLAEDLVAVKTVTIFPAEAQDRPQEVDLGRLDPSVRFIGLLALYPREEPGKPRKIVVPVAEAGRGIWEFTGYHLRPGQ